MIDRVMLEEAPAFLLGVKLAKETLVREGIPGMLIASVDDQYVGEIVYQVTTPEQWERHIDRWGPRRNERYFGPDGAKVLFVHWLSVRAEYRRQGFGTVLLSAAFLRTRSDAICGIVGHRAFPKACVKVLDSAKVRVV